MKSENWFFWKKKKSEKIIEVCKEDIQEFTQSITNDTKEAIVHSSEVLNQKINEINNNEEDETNGEHSTEQSNALLSKIKNGISTLLDQLPSPSSPTLNFIFTKSKNNDVN